MEKLKNNGSEFSSIGANNSLINLALDKKSNTSFTKENKRLKQTLMIQKTLYQFMNKSSMLCRLSKIQVPKKRMSNNDIQ